jgi:hypothetical protein
MEGTTATRWVATLDRGEVTLESGHRAADATARLDRALFERMVEGDANATAAVLRGEVQLDGGLDLLMEVHRVFPGPDPGRPDDCFRRTASIALPQVRPCDPS